MHTTSPKGFIFSGTGKKELLRLIEPSAPGNVQVRVDWQGGEQLDVIMNVDSQTGYIARKDGTSPLILDHYYSRQALDRDKTIKVWVKWFPSKGTRTLSSFKRIQGTMVVTYPK